MNNVTISKVLYLAAVIVFVLAVLGVGLGTLPLIALGLAFVAAGLLLG